MLKTGLSNLCLLVALAACGTTGGPAPMSGGARQNQQMPEWVSNLSGYRALRQADVIAVGQGNSRQTAEAEAMRQLVFFFEVDVTIDQKVVDSFRGIEGGAGISHSAIDSAIALAAGMSLIGAEIGDAWTDGRGEHFALAVLNKAGTAKIYSEMIRTNQGIIDELTRMSQAERNTFVGFASFQLAAVIADMNASYSKVLAVIGAPPVQGLRRGDDLRRETQEIARSIPISIIVTNDRQNRIQGAFARSFADLGFRTGGANPRYVLNVDLVVRPTEHVSNRVFARLELNANLIDTSNNSVLIPFNFNQREGHNSESEAQNMAFTRATDRIGREYGNLLSGYISSLLQGR